jgi:hypothetical protein
MSHWITPAATQAAVGLHTASLAMQQLRLVTARGCVAAAVLGVLFTFITLRLTLVSTGSALLSAAAATIVVWQHSPGFAFCHRPPLPPSRPPAGQWHDAATHRPRWTAQLRTTANLHQ